MPAPQTWIFSGDFATAPKALSGAVAAWVDAVTRSVEDHPGGTVIRLATIPSTGTFSAACATQDEFTRALCGLSYAAIKAVAEVQQETGDFVLHARVEFDPARAPELAAPEPAPRPGHPLRRFTLLSMGFGLLPLLCYQVSYPGPLGALLVLPPAVLFGLLAAAAIEITRALVAVPDEFVLDD